MPRLSQNMDYVNHKKKTTEKSKPGLITTICILGIVVAVFALFGKNVTALFSPVSIAGSITQVNLKETDGRTNILVLGSDKRSTGTVTSDLTDTILIASIGKLDNDVILISVPRDLWVQSPKGYHSKINAIYAYGGVDELQQVLQNVLGIPTHYYTIINFDLFKEVIDILGGVNVNVEKAFTDRLYPIEGKENAPENQRYEVIAFTEGTQIMNGETALKYVRSRKGNNDEGTDFARSKRQQKIILALKEKATSLDTLLNLGKLKNLYDTYSKNVETNIDFATIQAFYDLSKQIDFGKVKSVVLDDRSAADEGGILYAPEDTSLYGGAYVLIPRSGDFSQVRAYVSKYLFSK